MAATSTNTKKTKPDFARAIATSVAGPNQKEHAAPEPAEEKRTAGRPSSGRTIKITLAIPEDLMDGIEAVKKIKEADADANIIMCSAIGQQAMVIEALKAGAKDFIVKPFQPDRIIASIERVLG